MFHLIARPAFRRMALAAALLTAPSLHAALPPYAQTMRDLEDLTKYLDAHQGVSARLEHIDLVNYTLKLRGGCQVHFKRKKVAHPPGWVGPASPLVFDRATCEIPKY